MAVLNYSDTVPAPPSGKTNAKWQADPAGTDPRNVSLYMPTMVGDSGSGGTSGAVPAPAAGDAAAGKFLSANGTFAVPGALGTQPYDIGIFIPGTLTSSNQIIARWIPPRAITFAAGIAPSTATASAASTGTAVFSLQKNGVQFGTLTYTASATGVFAAASPASFNGTSDVLSIVGPASADLTLANIGMILSGTR